MAGFLRDGFFHRLRKSSVQRRALRQRQRRFPVLLLSTGGTCWHADERRMSIAAAIQWALQSNLQGLVLDSGAVQEQSQAVALARSKGLKVKQFLLWAHIASVFTSEIPILPCVCGMTEHPPWILQCLESALALCFIES